MANLRKKVEINATPESVWAVLIELEHWADWTPSITSIERLDGGPLGVGSRVRVLQPKLPPAVWTVTVWEPGSRFAWESRRLGVRTLADHVIVPGKEGTTVEFGVEFGGPFGGVAGRLASKLTKRYMAFEAGGLKGRCEHGPSWVPGGQE